jgi:hypothetical protein
MPSIAAANIRAAVDLPLGPMLYSIPHPKAPARRRTGGGGMRRPNLDLLRWGRAAANGAHVIASRICATAPFRAALLASMSMDACARSANPVGRRSGLLRSREFTSPT